MCVKHCVATDNGRWSAWRGVAGWGGLACHCQRALLWWHSMNCHSTNVTFRPCAAWLQVLHSKVGPKYLLIACSAWHERQRAGCVHTACRCTTARLGWTAWSSPPSPRPLPSSAQAGPAAQAQGSASGCTQTQPTGERQQLCQHAVDGLFPSAVLLVRPAGAPASTGGCWCSLS